MPSSPGVRRGIALGLLVLCVGLVAGCGSASRGGLYSVRQVKGAFAAHGIVLHKTSEFAMRGVSWLASPSAGRYREPGVMVVVLRPSAKGQFTYSSGGDARLQTLGDVRAVVTDKALTHGVNAALVQLGKESAPPIPSPPATTTAPAPPPLPTFAHLLAKFPRPLRDAVRKTANAPSAHVVLTGLMAGSGDFSTVRQVASLHSRFGGYRMDEIIVGSTVYRRSTIPGRRFAKWSGKWVEQPLSQSPDGISSGWPGIGLLTLIQPLESIGGAGRLSTVGHEMIRGVETTHYRERIAFPTGGIPSAFRAEMADFVDVWVGSRDGLIRRASECFAGTHVFTANVSRFGEDIHVAIPSGGAVITPPAITGKPRSFVSVQNGLATGSGGNRCG